MQTPQYAHTHGLVMVRAEGLHLGSGGLHTKGAGVPETIGLVWCVLPGRRFWGSGFALRAVQREVLGRNKGARTCSPGPAL